MKQFVYSSHRSLGFLPNLIFEMLEKAQKHNESHGITGLLIYGNNHFLQVIEGEDEPINTLIDNIMNDPRHYNIVVHDNRSITSLTFTLWRMSFVRLESSSQKRRSTEFLKHFLPNEMNAEQALQFLVKMDQHLHHIEQDQLSKTLSMVFVDHHPEMKTFLEQQLIDSPHLITFFTSSAETLIAIRQGLTMDAMIYEDHPSNQNSLSFIKEFRQLKPDVPILIVFDDSDRSKISNCLKAGADGYLMKPYHYGALKTSLREAILNHELNGLL